MNNISALMAKLGEVLLPAVNKLFEMTIEVIEGLEEVVTTALRWTKDFTSQFEGFSLYDAGVKIIESLGAGMWSVLTGMVDEIQAKLAGIVPDWMQRAWSWASGGDETPASTGSPAKRALGGPVRAGIAYQWQEEGRELFVPAMDGRVVSNRDVRASAVRVAPETFHATFNIAASPGMSPRDVAEAVERRMRRFAEETTLALHDRGLYA
jgi:hypothetical protein